MNYKEQTEKIYNEVIENKDVEIIKSAELRYVKRIKRELANYNNVASKYMEDDGKYYLFVKYQEERLPFEEIKIMYDRATEAYLNGNNGLCIHILRELLKREGFNMRVFAKLGMAYYKCQNTNMAIKYLTVANVISKNIKGRFNFDELLLVLSSSKGMDKKDLKPVVLMKEEEFINKENNYDELFNKLYNYLVVNKVNFTDGCVALGLSDEEINIMALVFAKNYYIHHEVAFGDLFVKFYEKRNGKTLNTKLMYNELVNKKKIYLNKELDEDIKSLSLAIKVK